MNTQEFAGHLAELLKLDFDRAQQLADVIEERIKTVSIEAITERNYETSPDRWED